MIRDMSVVIYCTLMDTENVDMEAGVRIAFHLLFTYTSYASSLSLIFDKGFEALEVLVPALENSLS